MAETCQCPYYFRYWLRDNDIVYWHHYCQHSSPSKLIQVNLTREAPPRPEWCKKEAERVGSGSNQGAV